jgi:hypothetical protein
MARTPSKEAALGAGTAGGAASHARSDGDRDAVIAGAIQVFRSVGVTAADLRAWAPWCPALGELADAMSKSTPMAGAA